MCSLWPRVVPALVLALWCLGLLHAQVLDHNEGDLGGTEFAPPNTDGSAGAKQPPHLILIVADDLGWNDVSWHNPAVLSPHLGQLAAEGITLNRSYVQPICTPTRSALLASRYPFTIGRQNNVLLPMTPTGLSLDVSLLPQELHKLGYETNMVGKWHLGFCKDEYTPTMRGFDSFFGYYTGAEDYYSHVTNDSYKEGRLQDRHIVDSNNGARKLASGYDFRINMTVDREVAGTYSAFSFADHANFLLTERNPAQPLFLYLAFQSVHAPLQVPQNYSDLYSHIQDRNRRTYLGMVTAMDEAVGKVVATLKATGHYDNSVIVFTTDNGGPTVAGSSNSPLRGNKTTLWEGGTRGPAFIHSPLLSSPGILSNRTIHVTDWFPTFLHLAGGSPPPGIDGVNQWEVLNNSSMADARDFFVYDIDDTDGLRAAVRWNQYKLIVGDPGAWPPAVDEDKATHHSVNDGVGKYKVGDPGAWPPAVDEDKATHHSVNDGVGRYKVSGKATVEDIQNVDVSGQGMIANMGSAKSTKEPMKGKIELSDKEGDSFLHDAVRYFSVSGNAQRQDLGDITADKTLLSINEARSEKKRQLLEEPRGVNTDLGSRRARIEDFNSVSELVNSNLDIQLFDVVGDPTESDDISGAHSDIVELILTRLQDEFARYVTSDFPPDDAKGDPSNFNSTWSPGWC